MSSKQTESRKGKVEVPEGWSLLPEEGNGKPSQPTGTDDTTGIIQPEESNDTRYSQHTDLTGQREQDEQTLPTEPSLQTESSPLTGITLSTVTTSSTIPKRTSGRQRKESLEEYRQVFLTVPRLEDRKPVFVSREVRDRLDEITRKLGGRRMSVSGFIENLARHHLETYGDEIEAWKKM